jgi:hypothetical protein
MGITKLVGHNGLSIVKISWGFVYLQFFNLFTWKLGMSFVTQIL